MAKKPQVPAKVEKKSVKAKSEAGVPAFLEDEVEMTGAGVSTDQADNLIPMARILQKGSPEVERKAAAYVPGAEAGKIFIKNVANPMIDGDEGFLFQPCYFQKAVVEWLPRNKGGGGGAGFAAMHPEMPKDAVQKPDPQNPDKMQWVRKNGNICVDTRYHGGFIIDENGGAPQPVVIPFTSTGHTVSRAWMSLMNQKRINGARADSWAVYYRFKTIMRDKGGGMTWYIFQITDAGPEEDNIPTTMWVPTMEDYERGKTLHESISSGAQRFAVEDEEPDERPSGSSSNERM